MSRQELRLAPFQKLATHPQYADYLAGKPIVPVNVEISPSGVCNASCDFCFYANTGELGSHRKVFLDYGTLHQLISDCQNLGVRSISWTGGGDPSLYPSIGPAVSCASRFGLRQGMFTNALAKPKYQPERLDWIRVTRTDKPYNVEALHILRRCETLGFAYNYAGPHDLQDLFHTLFLAEEVKADYVQLRPALKFHGETVDIQPPNINHPLLVTTGYKFEDARVKHGYKTCEGYHFVPFVWEDGNVDVCAYMRKERGYTLGNLYQESFADIMRKAPTFVPVLPNCQVCCRNHEINKAIHGARELLDREFP